MSPVPSHEELIRRRFCDSVEDLLSRLQARLEGNVLKKILSDGGFSATESKAVIEKLGELQDAFDDLTMALLFQYDH